MSTFGSPGGRQQIAKPIPPERGSFPLDHDAECKPFMTKYLRCLRTKKGVNEDECRMLSKAYLQCRMEKNLMAPDEMRNLGYAEDGAAVIPADEIAVAAHTKTAGQAAGGGREGTK